MGTLAEFGTRMRNENDKNIILGMKSSKNLIKKKREEKGYQAGSTSPQWGEHKLEKISTNVTFFGRSWQVKEIIHV